MKIKTKQLQPPSLSPSPQLTERDGSIKKLPSLLKFREAFDDETFPEVHAMVLDLKRVSNILQHLEHHQHFASGYQAGFEDAIKALYALSHEIEVETNDGLTPAIDPDLQ